MERRNELKNGEEQKVLTEKRSNRKEKKPGEKKVKHIEAHKVRERERKKEMYEPLVKLYKNDELST